MFFEPEIDIFQFLVHVFSDGLGVVPGGKNCVFFKFVVHRPFLHPILPEALRNLGLQLCKGLTYNRKARSSARTPKFPARFSAL